MEDRAEDHGPEHTKTNQTDHGISALTGTFKVCYLLKKHGKIPELHSDGRNGLAFSSECVCLRTTANDIERR